MSLRVPTGRRTTSVGIGGSEAQDRAEIERAAARAGAPFRALGRAVGQVVGALEAGFEERQQKLDVISDATVQNEHRIKLSEISTNLGIEASQIDLADPDVAKEFDLQIQESFAGIENGAVSSQEKQVGLNLLRDRTAAGFRNDMAIRREQSIVAKAMIGIDQAGTILGNEVRDGTTTLADGLKNIDMIVDGSGLSPQTQAAERKRLRARTIESSILGDINARRLIEAEETIDSDEFKADLSDDRRDVLRGKVKQAKRIADEEFAKTQAGHAQSIQDIIKFGQVTQPMIDAARKHDFISGHQWSNLSGNLRNFNSAEIVLQQKEDLGNQFILGGRSMNPADPRQQGQVDAAFAAGTLDKSDEEVLIIASDVSRVTGYIPKTAEDIIHGMISRGNPNGWAEAAKFKAGTRAVSPALWQAKYTDREMAILSAMEKKLSFGLNPQEAAAEIQLGLGASETERIARTKAFRASLDIDELRRTVTKTVNDPNSLSWFPWSNDFVDAAATAFAGEELDPRERNAALAAARTMAPLGTALIGPFLGAGERADLPIPSAMLSDVIDRLEVETARLGPEMAFEPAIEAVLRKWAPTRQGDQELDFAPDQRKFLWKAHPPELLHTSPGRDFDWFYNQKRDFLIESKVAPEDVDRTALVPDRRTQFDGSYMAIITPENQPIFAEDGSISRFFPNYAVSPEGKAEVEQLEKDAAIRKEASQLGRQLQLTGQRNLLTGSGFALRTGLVAEDAMNDVERAGFRLRDRLESIEDIPEALSDAPR